MAQPSPLPVVAAAVTAGIVGAWYLSAPGRTPVTALADIGGILLGSISLTPAQQSMATVISREFGIAGLGWLTNAAIANAYAESRLDPTAVGDNGHAVGLFQLNDAVPSAAGYGMSVESRMDPVLNCRRIIVIVNDIDGGALRASRGTATHADLAVIFARDIERCYRCGHAGGDAELTVRRTLVSQLFGPAIAGQVP